MNPISLTISAKSLTELHNTVLGMAKEIETNQGPSAPEVMYGDQSHVTDAPAPAPNKPKGSVKFNLASEAKAQDVIPDTPVSVSNSSDLDSEGFPWDERIHSGNKEKKTDGTWRSRRGADPVVIEQVKAELSAAGYGKKVPAFGSMSPEQYSAHLQKEQAPTPQLAIVPPMPTTAVHASLPQGAPMQQPAVPTFAPPAAPAPVGNVHTAESFRQNLMTILNNLAKEKKITHENIQEWSRNQFGGKEVQHWADNVEVCNGLFEGMVNWGWIVKAN